MNSLPKLNLPDYNLRLRSVDEGTQIWDSIRLKWLLLTPEEWVRQNFIRYMVEELGVPAHYLIQEYGVSMGGGRQRADILVCDPRGNNVMVVECKASDIAVDASVFAQVVRYNSVIKAEYVVLTNGMKHVCCQKNADKEGYTQLRAFPNLSSCF